MTRDRSRIELDELGIAAVEARGAAADLAPLPVARSSAAPIRPPGPSRQKSPGSEMFRGPRPPLIEGKLATHPAFIAQITPCIARRLRGSRPRGARVRRPSRSGAALGDDGRPRGRRGPSSWNGRRGPLPSRCADRGGGLRPSLPRHRFEGRRRRGDEATGRGERRRCRPRPVPPGGRAGDAPPSSEYDPADRLQSPLQAAAFHRLRAARGRVPQRTHEPRGAVLGAARGDHRHAGSAELDGSPRGRDRPPRHQAGKRLRLQRRRPARLGEGPRLRNREERRRPRSTGHRRGHLGRNSALHAAGANPGRDPHSLRWTSTPPARCWPKCSAGSQR